MSRSRSQRSVARQHLGQEHRCCLCCLRIHKGDDCESPNIQLHMDTSHPLRRAICFANLIESQARY